MKEFMMIFLGADYGTVGLSPEQMQERMGKWFAWGDKMAKAGVLRSGEALDNRGTPCERPEKDRYRPRR
jgi:hypothetical protein